MQNVVYERSGHKQSPRLELPPGLPDDFSFNVGGRKLEDMGVAAIPPPAPVPLPAPSTAQPAVGVFRSPYNPGDTFKDCDLCPEMVVVPAGTFTMGSPPGKGGPDDNEGPQHRVTIALFAMGKTEVTFAQWEACVTAGGCNGFHPTQEFSGSVDEDLLPVIGVSWNDAKAYVSWLSQYAGKPYRLPSEAEWEYAARAGTTTTRFWGNNAKQGCLYANMGDLTTADTADLTKMGDLTAKDQLFIGRRIANCRDGYLYKAPVGTFRPNGFGLYDMIGNVREWVEDCWHEDYAGAPSDGSAWTSGGRCSPSVDPNYGLLLSVLSTARGGDWQCEPWDCRSASRNWAGADSRTPYNGFRVARTLD